MDYTIIRPDPLEFVGRGDGSGRTLFGISATDTPEKADYFPDLE